MSACLVLVAISNDVVRSDQGRMPSGEGWGANGGGGLNDGGYRVWLRTLLAEMWPDEDLICPGIHRYPKRLIESLALREFADNPNEPSDVSFVLAITYVISNASRIGIIGLVGILL